MLKNKMTLSLLASALISGVVISGPPTASAASGQEGNIEKSVNFREKPSLSGNTIRYLKAGEHVNILDQVNLYGYKIKDQRGQTGYVTTQRQYIETNISFPDKPVRPVSGTSRSVINAGMKYLGTPYEFGSSRSNIHTFDCSDFVRQAFKDGAGVILPGDSRSQAAYVKKLGNTTTNLKNLKPGDIMFFISYKGSRSSDYTGINKSLQRITHNGITAPHLPNRWELGYSHVAGIISEYSALNSAKLCDIEKGDALRHVQIQSNQIGIGCP